MRIIVPTKIKCSFKVIHKTCLFKCHTQKYQLGYSFVWYEKLAGSDIV